jgi:hypothetical protein
MSNIIRKRGFGFLAAVTATLVVAAALPAGARAAAAVPGFEPYPSMPAGNSLATDDAAEALSALVEAAPDVYTGVRVVEAGKVLVTVAPGADRGAIARSLQVELGRTGRGVGMRLTVAAVPRSLAEIRLLKAELVPLLTDSRYRGLINGVGLDPSRGVVVVYASEDSAAARTEIKARYGDAVVFRLAGPANLTEANRDRDTANHWAGAGYLRWNAAHTAFRDAPGTDIDWCSTSFPVIRAGTRYMLTAGHCVPGQAQFPHLWASFDRDASLPGNGYYFGTGYTTTVSGTEANPTDGTQDTLGDWTLLRGSTYDPRVYNCLNTTGACTELPVGQASWGEPSMGVGACSSGRTTGQLCRYRVVDPDATMNFGFDIARLAVLRSNQDATGGDDCMGFRGGDSGGAIYQSIGSRPGYVRAMGIVTGTSTSCPSNYYYTKLAGVRAWDPSITMPTL